MAGDAFVACFLLDPLAMPGLPRWLIVVDRDRPDIFQDFGRRFRGWARVVLDRRVVEPDGASEYEGPERRRPPVERRNPFLRHNAYRLVYKVEGFELHELTEPAAVPDEAEAGSAAYRI